MFEKLAGKNKIVVFVVNRNGTLTKEFGMEIKQIMLN
jgi:hypothetical protein